MNWKFAVQVEGTRKSLNKSALKNCKSRLPLGDELRSKEAIKFTRNRISSLRVFHVLLHGRSSIFQDIYLTICF